jgi:hypothetical protein
MRGNLLFILAHILCVKLGLNELDRGVLMDLLEVVPVEIYARRSPSLNGDSCKRHHSSCREGRSERGQEAL